MNGWTKRNECVRKEILNTVDPDVICLLETKLMKIECINFQGYTFYGHNRQLLKTSAKCGSVGVAILIKSKLLNQYIISITDKHFDGILTMKLTSKENLKEIIITVCYLPPEGSERGRIADEFLNHLCSIVYTYINSELMVFCGDLNARISDMNDVIANIDDVPSRQVKDSVKNRHGDLFIDFLRETKLCILNGSITNEYNDYTSVSAKRKAVFDYVFTPH